MTVSTPPSPTRRGPEDSGSLLLGDGALTHGQLPRWTPWALAAGALLLAGALVLALGLGLIGLVVLAILLFTVALYVTSRVTEGRRKATDRLVTVVVSSAFALAMVPLLTIVYAVVSNGLQGLSLEFLTTDQRGVVSEGGGIAHAILGTAVITGAATLISVPIGIMTAVYLVEYGRGPLARAVTFLVDVMTGIPSIVAGLFAYALFVLFFGPGVRLGIAGAVALAVLMTPIVIRSTEEMLKLVPNELREASYALGIPKWRTVVRVVLPTSVAGIATGITISIARVIGETAPLLIVAGFTRSINLDLFDGRMMTLPVFTYYSYVQPGVPPEVGQSRAWSAALALIIIVLVLNLVARLISRYLSPKTSR